MLNEVRGRNGTVSQNFSVERASSLVMSFDVTFYVENLQHQKRQFVMPTFQQPEKISFKRFNIKAIPVT